MQRCSDFISDATKDLLEEYTAHTRAKRTGYEYAGYLNLLCDYVKKDFLDITEMDAASYFDYLKAGCHGGDLSVKTVCARLSCYRSFARYILVNHPEVECIDAFLKIKRPDIADDIHPNHVPSLEEMDAVMTVAKESPMYYLIFALAARVGLSSSNIISIRKDTIIEEQGRMYLTFPPKNDLEEALCVMLPEDVERIMRSYLNTVSATDYIFLNERRRPLSQKNLVENVEKIITKSGVGHYTLKDFRTRAVLELVHAGVPIETISGYTGLKTLRIQSFLKAEGFVSGECPADLVNFQLKTL